MHQRGQNVFREIYCHFIKHTSCAYKCIQVAISLLLCEFLGTMKLKKQAFRKEILLKEKYVKRRQKENFIFRDFSDYSRSFVYGVRLF